MKRIQFIFISITLACHVHAQLPSNNFEGVLKHENQTLNFIFKCSFELDAYKTLLYIPEQFIYEKRANNTYFEDDSINIQFRDFQAHYAGRIIRDSMLISGKWVQRGTEFPLTLYFKSFNEATSFERPQEPKPPFPYVVSEHTIPNRKEKINLSGTLTLPDTTQIHTLVILISGSGPQDRNEELGGHKPFLVIADYLTRNGIAVFRFDDRGVGKSEGDYTTATTMDFANDVMSIVKYFKKHPHINPKKIGLIGHSEGGIVSMMVASKMKKDVSFIVSLAGPGVTMVDLLLRQTEDIMRAAGAKEDFIEITRLINYQMYNLAMTEPNPDSLMNKMSGFLIEATADLSETEIEKYGLNKETIRMSAMQLYTPWMKYFLTIRPSEYLQKIKCPVLALNGSLDIQVAADDNLEAIDRYIREGKNYNVKTVKMNGLNHLFQKAEKGTIGEYMVISETFNQLALQEILQFLKAR